MELTKAILILTITSSTFAQLWNPLSYTCTISSNCLSDYVLLSSSCCGYVTGCTGDQASSYASDQLYCIEAYESDGISAVSSADLSCTGYCAVPEDSICTPIPQDGTVDQTSECQVYDTDNVSYCCAVQSLTNDGSFSITLGNCQSVSDVDSSENSLGYYTVCGAVATLSSAFVALAQLL